MAVSTVVTPPGVMKRRIAQVSDPENAYSRDAVDVFNGPVILQSVEIQNLVATGSKAYVKLYDNVTAALVPGTTAPDFIIPVPAYVANPFVGKQIMQCPDGIPFENGVSVFAAQEDGDAMTTAPDQTLEVFLVA